jgi:RHS repeat-associated protein
VHQEPYSKGQRITNSTGAITSTVEVDPFGGETNRSVNSAFQPKKYTSYIRDNDGGDDAMHRRYSSVWSRFSQPDPYDGSYDASDPQSFNRYAYVTMIPLTLSTRVGYSKTKPAERIKVSRPVTVMAGFGVEDPRAVQAGAAILGRDRAS